MIKLTNIEDFSGESLLILSESIVSIERADLHGMCVKKGDYPFLDENIYNQRNWFFIPTCSIKRTKITLKTGNVHYVKEDADLIYKLKNRK